MSLENTLKNLELIDGEVLAYYYLRAANINKIFYGTEIEDELQKFSQSELVFSFSMYKENKTNYNYSIIFEMDDRGKEEVLFYLNKKPRELNEQLMRETLVFIHHDFKIDYKGYMQRDKRIMYY